MGEQTGVQSYRIFYGFDKKGSRLGDVKKQEKIEKGI